MITSGPSAYGQMLFDVSGQAIYLFAKETHRPRCYRACAAAWPPVLTRGLPQAQGNARFALLGAVPRRDGTLQLTYDRHPLYF